MRAVLVLALLPALAAAQSTATGAVEGVVSDATGAVLPGVRVTLRHQGSAAARATATGDAGQFRLVGLAPGAYTLRLEREGFTTLVLESLDVSVGRTLVQRVEMKPAQVVDKVEVREQAGALDAASSSAGVGLGGDRIEESPASNRNYLNFVLVAPGVASSSGSSAQRAAAAVRAATADSGFSFAGLRGRNNSLQIDGVDNRDETTGGNRVAVGLEMVQEFRVSGAPLAAEFGGAAGGSVNMVTRSGTNLWHGDATFFGQQEALNARNPESLAPRRPRFRRRQPGVSLNGPIRRDRTFFSTAFEQEWESSEEWSETPAAFAAALRAALESPRFARAATHEPLRGLFPASADGTEFSFKLNHQFGSAHAVSARYALSRGHVKNDAQSGDNFLDRSARGGSFTRDDSLVASWLAVPTPHAVSDLRVQASRRRVELIPNSPGAMLEIPGVITFGRMYTLDADRTESHYQAVESFSLNLGRHQLGFGASAHEVRLDARLANRFGGIFVFPALDDFVAGRPDVFIQAFGEPRTRFGTTPCGAWIQDRWQPGAGLTVDWGLRWDGQLLPAPIPPARRNFSPRLGVAWHPPGSSSFVVRAGFGLFFDRYPLAYLNDAIQKDGQRAFEQYATGGDAQRVFDLSLGGPLSSPLAGLRRSAYRPAAPFPSTYARKFTAGVERALGDHTTISAEFLAVRGFHLPRISIYSLEQNANSDYLGGTVTVQRRLTRNLTYLAAYSAGRTRDDASDYDENPQNPADLRAEWARSRQHQAHRIAASGLFEFPAALLPWEPLREALEEITLAPIFTAGSGRPVRALDSTDSLRTGAFPLSARPFGLGRNPFDSPGTISLDLRAMKSIWLKPDRTVLQFGAEAFNLINHSNPLRVSPFFAAGGQKLSTYRGVVETLPARQVQLFVQLEY
jgi:hypothetical protein